MRQNPCRHCALSDKFGDRYVPSDDIKCVGCKNLKKHKEYLKAHRKFVEGDLITDLSELLEQEWVMWYHKTKHIEVFKSMQIRIVLRWLEMGAFRKAIRKESEEK